MSFFFDVLFAEGFILASDVRLVINEESHFAHKIAPAPHGSTVNCAMAVCGVEPELCLRYFSRATALRDTLKEVANCFAAEWTNHYAGTNNYSAVHLVGFEKTGTSGVAVPQMWYWRTWDNGSYLTKQALLDHLETFADPIPYNDHIPRIIEREAGRFDGTTLEDEYHLVVDFLQQHQPLFTWNGDSTFWQSATDTVGAAMRLLRNTKESWTYREISDLTGICLSFLLQLASFLRVDRQPLTPRRFGSTTGNASEGRVGPTCNSR